MVHEGRRVEIVQHSDINANVVTNANSRVLELGSTYTEVVKRLQIEGHQQTSVRIKGLELLVDSSWRFYSRFPLLPPVPQFLRFTICVVHVHISLLAVHTFLRSKFFH